MKSGASAALIMINKLHRRKRNTTGFLKIFFTQFWDFIEEKSGDFAEFKKVDENSQLYNNLTNSLDLVGKVKIWELHDIFFHKT